MLPLQKVLEVKRLLDEGKLSRRAIAAQTGVGRGSVNAIANGERGLFGAGVTPPAEDGPEYACSVEPERCPGCGARVYTPCVQCAAREAASRREATRETRHAA